MLIMHTVESTFAEVTFHGRLRIAERMRVALNWIQVTWVPVAEQMRCGVCVPCQKQWEVASGAEACVNPSLVERPEKGVRPRIDLQDPSTAPLTSDQQSDLPPLRDTLRAHGVSDPESVLGEAAQWMVRELVWRLRAFA